MSETKMFDAPTIAAWDAALDRQPRRVDEIEWPSLPQVEAFAADALGAGFVVRFRTRDGSEPAFVMNPVAARHLALTIIHMGTEAGWLDQGGNLLIPDRPPLDS